MSDFIAYIAPRGPVVEPPVHQDTIVDLFYSDGYEEITDAGGANWSAEGEGPHVVAYSVVKKYVKPQECFGVVSPDGVFVVGFLSSSAALLCAGLLTGASVIRMVEVQE